MVPGLIGPFTVPNPAMTGSPGRELRGGADYGIGLAHIFKHIPKDLGTRPGRARFGQNFPDFFLNGPKWSSRALGVLFGALGYHLEVMGVGGIAGGLLITHHFKRDKPTL